MKKIFRSSVLCTALLALCGAAATATPMLAQGGGGRMAQSPDQQVAALTTALTLTADQQAKVKEILEADVKPMADARAGQDREAMMKIRTDEHAKIKALLTPEQATKYDAMPQGRGRMGGMGGGGGSNQ
jgi:Spy/CpxP family protein refolding chaperone